MESKIFAGLIKAAPEGGGAPTFDHLVSVFNVRDHAGDVVAPGAFKDSIDRIKASGHPMAAYYGHRMDDPDYAVGTVVDLAEVLPGDPRLRGMGGDAEKNGGLLARIAYDDTPKAQQVVKMLNDGRLYQSSFTYDVLDGSFVSAEKAKELGKAVEQDHYELRKLELLEAGPVQLGCNDQTAVLAVKSRQAAWKADTDRPVADKGALPVSVGPKACVDGAWDGPAAQAKISADATSGQLAAFYAWREDGGDPESKSSYRFIHHGVGDDGHAAAANLKACVTGIGVLNGGRGGTTIPEGDVKGVYAHLAAHIREAGQEPPELKAREVSSKDYSPAPYSPDADETVKCANCGKMNDTDARFCDQCGHSLTGPGDASVEGKARKAGRVLSGSNAAALSSAMEHHQKAMDLVAGVLSNSSSGEDDGGADSGKSGGPGRATGGASGRSTETTADLLAMEQELFGIEID